MSGQCLQASASQASVSTASWTTFSSLTTSIDTGTFWSSGAASLVTIPDNGLYLVVAHVTQNKQNLSFGRGPRIILNGQTTWPCGNLTQGWTNSGNNGRGTYTAICAMFRSGDYLEFQGRQDEGSTDTINLFATVVRLPTSTAFCANTLDDQSLAAADTWYDATLPSKAFNGGGSWSWTTTDVTVPTTGNYLIFGHATYSDKQDGATQVAIEVQQNGNSLGQQFEKNGGSGHFYTIRALTAGDTIKMRLRVSDVSGVAGTFNSHGLTLAKLGACVNAYGAAQNISNGSLTAMALNNEYVDTDSYHDNSTNNKRITVPSGKNGKYLALTRWEANTMTRDGQSTIRINGGTEPAHWYVCAAANTRVGSLQVMDLAVSDYIESLCESDNSSPQITTSHYAPEFGAVYLDDFSYDTLTTRQAPTCPWTRYGFVPQISRRR